MSENNAALALTVPRHPIGLTMDLRMLWEDVLKRSGGHKVQNVYSHPDSDNGFPRNEDLEVIQKAGALVVATYNTRHLELDVGVLHHISFAQEFGKPVFCQSPLEDIMPPFAEAFDLDRAEITVIGNEIGMINDKLGVA